MSSESAVKARRARKARPCMDCNYYGGYSASWAIQPGDVYLVVTDFKGSDAGYAQSAGHPVQGAVCEHCVYIKQRPLIEARKAKINTPREAA